MDLSDGHNNGGHIGADRDDEVLVTGAAGFIGGHIARTCAHAGWKVTAVDLRPLPAGTAAAATAYQGRADSPSVLDAVRAGRYRAVVHQGAISSTTASDWDKLYDHNVSQALALAEACALSGTLFVYASSHSVYGTLYDRVAAVEGTEDDPAVCSGPLNLYARSKLTLDREMAARFGTDTPWVGLRYTNVFGPGETHKGPMASMMYQLLRDAGRGHPLRLFADTITACRDYIPVETVATIVVYLLSHRVPPRPYNLGSGKPISFGTLLEWCADLTGSAGLDVKLVPNGISAKYQYWTCADMRRTHQVIPVLTDLSISDLRAAADRLFCRLAGRTPQPC